MGDLGGTRCRSWHGHTSRTTTVSLSGDHVIFEAGTPSRVAIADILEVHDEGAIRGGNGNKALLLRLKNGEGDVGIMMTPAEHQVWLDELVGRGLKLTHA